MAMSCGVGHFVDDEAEKRYVNCYETIMGSTLPPDQTLNVPTSFGQVRVYRYGRSTGAPLVLLHGFLGSGAMWVPNIAGLAEAHTVYVVDQLGQPGLSKQSVPIRRARDCALWLGEMLTALDTQPAHLVGVSQGGWMALNQAVRDSDRVASVTLIEPANTLARFRLRFLVRGMAVPLGLRKLSDSYLSWIAGNPSSTGHPSWPLLQILLAGNREYRFNPAPVPYPRNKVLRSVPVPVLALLGGRSVLHDADAAANRAQTVIPTAQAHVWRDAGHALSAEYADEVNDRILAFVAEHTA